MKVDFQGKIVFGDDIIFEEVSGYYITQGRGALKKWFGALEVKSDEMPRLFRGRLITDAGQQGDCFGTLWSPGESTIEFLGSGDIG